MARVKGATASDQAAHRIFDANLNRMKTGAICPNCSGELKTAYHYGSWVWEDCNDGLTGRKCHVTLLWFASIVKSIKMTLKSVLNY